MDGGGGGDTRTFQLRLRVLKKLKQMALPGYGEVIHMLLPSLPIEISNNEGVAIQYKGKIPQLGRIIVPNNLVDIAASDISWYISSIMPEAFGIPIKFQVVCPAESGLIVLSGGIPSPLTKVHPSTRKFYKDRETKSVRSVKEMFCPHYLSERN